MSPTDKLSLLVIKCARKCAGMALFLLALATGACRHEDEKNSESLQIRPAACPVDVRQELDRLLRLTARVNEADEKKFEHEYAERLGSLVLASQRDGVGFERELIGFAVAAEEAHDQMAEMLVFMVAHVSLASKGEILQALQPYLTKSDAATQTVVWEFLCRIEGASIPPDFSYYPLSDEGAAAATLIEHMFSRSPGDALQKFVLQIPDRHAMKPLLWARHLVDDALWKRQYGFVPPSQPDADVTAELDKMARHDEWWARLYAAAVIRQHPEFGAAEMVERLVNDPHPLIQKTIKGVSDVMLLSLPTIPSEGGAEAKSEARDDGSPTEK